MIEPGQPVPAVPTKLVTTQGVSDTTTDAVLGSGLVVLFTVPGAFTPTCHGNHLPGFVDQAAALRTAGVSRIVCAAVNDQHVLAAWAKASDALAAVDFLADGNGAFAAALGLSKDFSGGGMGQRFARAALVLRGGVVEQVFVETAPGVETTGAPAILAALTAVAA